MARIAMARRMLALSCLFLAIAPFQSAAGQEAAQEVAQEIDNLELDEVVNEVADSIGGNEDNSESDEDIVEVFLEANDEDDSAEDDSGGGGGGSDSGSSGGGGGFVNAFGGTKKKAKKGNKLCGWSWAEKRCEPAALCHYKYQFLDATVSESCRLKDFSVTREVFEDSKVRVKPAVALAGAAALFSADLAAIRYTDWLQRFPVLFNVAQGFVLFVSGDTLFQVLEQGWKKVVGLRFWRMARSGLIGALNNGLVHYSYYKWIDKRFPYDKFSEKRWGPSDGALSKLAVGFTKWAIEWPTIGVYKIASMFILTAAMSGSVKGLGERMKDSFFLTWLRSLQVWPIYDMVLYAYVPTAHRPLFNSFMSIAWGGYLSHVSQPHVSDADEGEDLIPMETS